MNVRAIALIGAAALFAACSSAPIPVARQNEQPIRATAMEFTQALKNGEGSRLQELAVKESDPEAISLSQAVIADALEGRQLQLALAQHFGTMEPRREVGGTDAWLSQWETAAASAPIMQAGNRVRIGNAGTEGCMFLRNADGKWRVEIAPTMVAEWGGRSIPDDPMMRYRLGTTLAVNTYMVERIKNGEFKAFADYENAKQRFWFEYMACAANGDDPQKKVLATLPPLPEEPMWVAEDR